MEEANKIYMHGLHRSLYNRTTLIVETVERILVDPQPYASEVDAALPSTEISEIVPKLEDVGNQASGIVKGALTAMVDLQIYLTSSTPLVAHCASSIENTVLTQVLLLPGRSCR